MMIRSTRQMAHNPNRSGFPALVARFALTVTTLLVARATLALASAMMLFVVSLTLAVAMTRLLASALFVLGPAIKPVVLCWRY